MSTCLRPYQEKCVNEVLGYLSRGIHTVLQGATGSGKTVQAVEIVQAVSREAAWPVLLTVHRRELLNQMSAALNGSGISHGLIADGERPDPRHMVQVASIDTLRARIDTGVAKDMSRYKLMVVDEAHHANSASWSMVAGQASNATRLGLTATPWRMDGKPLAALFRREVRGPSISDLVDMGFLARTRVIAPPNNISLTGVPKRGYDYGQGELAAIMDTPERAQIALRAYARWLPGKPAIVFCTSVDHCRHVAEVFRKGGWRAVSVDRSMGASERNAAIGGLATGGTQVLTSCMIVGEGLDIPSVQGAILLRPTLSDGLYLQQVGRPMRPNSDGSDSTVIDLTDNTLCHGLPEMGREWNLERGLIKPATWRPPRRCPHCWRVSAPSVVKCVECENRLDKPPPRAILALNEQTIRLARLVDLMPLVRTRDDLEMIAKYKAYYSGWVQHVISERPELAMRQRYR